MTPRQGPPPPPPEPLPVAVPDSHTHLNLAGGDAKEQIAAAAQVGVDRLVQVGVDVPTSHWSAKLAAEERAVVAAVALHPNEAPRLSDLDEALREIEALAAQPRVRGIGETGLDYYRTGEPGWAAQEESFRAHIAIAKRFDKTLVIHDRDAHTDVLRVLDNEGPPDRVVMHCFSGDAEFAAACIKRGFTLSFSGTVTFNSAGALREAAAATPLDLILVETDAPFLTPVPYRGRPNGSYLIPITVRAFAAVTGTDLETLCHALSVNGERMFGPWQ